MMETEFDVSSSGGTTEYSFPQGFINNSGVAWTGFRFELGFGIGAAFVRSTAGDLLDFDTPDADPPPTSSAFTILDHQPDVIDWSGGVVPSIGTVGFAFAIDVPDNLALVHPGGVNRFTLRQVPIAAAVPEPAVTLLVTGALAALGCVRRRRR